MSQALQHAKEQVLWGCKTMCERGYVLGTAGNISARVEGEDLFVITPTSLPYNELTMDDLVVADMQGNIVEGIRKPSIEFTMHRNILCKRPDVKCVVHTHSKYATAAGSMAGVTSVPAIDIETAIYIGGDIPVAPFAPPGSEALAQNVERAIGTMGGIIMESHGAIGVGKTMADAMVASDNIERTCEMFLAICAGGAVKPLPTDYVEESHKKSLKKRGVQA